jgi:Transposase family tnp2
VIQALHGSPETADKMHHCERMTSEILEYARAHGGSVREYSNTTCGHDYLDAIKTGKIKKDDVLVQLSLDGTQLYCDKDLDCWIFVYIIHNLPPDLRYRKRFVISMGFTPGPEKPKRQDLFLFPVLYHISALQTEGLQIWDASTQTHIVHSTPFVFVTADGPVMAMVSGMVGHSDQSGWCLYCGLPGCHRTGDRHYFPVMLKPNDYDIAGSNHADVTFSALRLYQQNVSTQYHNNLQRLIEANNLAQYKDVASVQTDYHEWLRDGFGIPNMFLLDIMPL